ncbi:MAG: DUF3536 domain-containing protein [Bacteroidota bacterium]
MKYITLHGHFYQPPRENAWLEEIEIQESARPFHDWNARITEECYGPNAVSRILNDEGRIVDITNNYARMSFNFGPTLLTWMEQNKPKIYQAIIAADAASMELYNGHGSAMAQVYNHIIMPLANRRDKVTQVVWGLRDFERRFGRDAEGMWLAETAVDTETLEVLVDNGIKFTVLAPSQAQRYRCIGGEEWLPGVDPRRPYLCRLPSGKHIYLFFYDGERSQAVAFGGLLENGRKFAESLMNGFAPNTDEDQLVHIATDGETYGHHHRNGDMALAYCMQYIKTNGLARLTNYSEYLSLVEVTHEVEIVEDSSWSCAHGIERWRSNCGCHTGGHLDWQQAWRTPLRDALNHLRDRFAEIYEREMYRFHDDPWGLRNEYVRVPLKRSVERAEAFLRAFVPRKLEPREQNRVLALLEMQRQSLYMFTSCGWFFNEISGIEPVQVLQYANRGIQLAKVYFGEDLEEEFLKVLERAPSNLSEYQSGREVYEKRVVPARLDLTQVGMHYAVRSIFTEDPEKQEVLNYVCKSEEFERYNAGSHRLVMGLTKVKSKITLSEAKFSFVILYLGHHHVIGHTFAQLETEEYRLLGESLKPAFDQANLSQVIEKLKEFPGQKPFSFFDMFKDEQIRLLQGILDEQLALASDSYRKINDRNYNLMNVMRASGLEVPDPLRKNLELVLNRDLRDLFADSDRRVSTRKLTTRVNELKKWNIPIDTEEYSYLLGHRLRRLAESIPGRTNRTEAVDNIRKVLNLARPIGINPLLGDVQNIVFHWLKQIRRGEEQEEFNAALIELARHINLDVETILMKRFTARVV